jgi:hypothetical protein
VPGRPACRVWEATRGNPPVGIPRRVGRERWRTKANETRTETASPLPHPRRVTPLGVIRRQPDMTLLSRIQRRHLPGQIVIPGPGRELVHAHRHTHRKGVHAAGAVRTTRATTDGGPLCCKPCGVRIPDVWGAWGCEWGTLLRGGCGRTPQRRAEFEAGSFATQLAFRQSVVPHLRRPHPLWPRSARLGGAARWPQRRHLQHRDALWRTRCRRVAFSVP